MLAYNKGKIMPFDYLQKYLSFSFDKNYLTQWELIPYQLSDLNTPETSKLDWTYFDHNKIDKNELQISKNLLKGTGTKLVKKMNSFGKFDRRKNKN